MPTYDYKCHECQHVQEEIHPMSGPNYEVICKKCGSKKMVKQISIFYAMFEGPGWDTNDNRGIAKTNSGSIMDSSDVRG